MIKPRTLLVLLLSAGSPGLAACDVPHDARNTLEAVSGDTLLVGVSEAPPWVIRRGEGSEPAGVEPELVRGFARSIDAEVVWLWGPPAEHMEALAWPRSSSRWT